MSLWTTTRYRNGTLGFSVSWKLRLREDEYYRIEIQHPRGREGEGLELSEDMGSPRPTAEMWKREEQAARG